LPLLSSQRQITLTFAVDAQALAATEAADVARFYRQALWDWRLASSGNLPEGWPRVATGPGGVEMRRYVRDDDSVSVDLAGFLVGGR
jgi:hypothetical protein